MGILHTYPNSIMTHKSYNSICSDSFSFICLSFIFFWATKIKPYGSGGPAMDAYWQAFPPLQALPSLAIRSQTCLNFFQRCLETKTSVEDRSPTVNRALHLLMYSTLVISCNRTCRLLSTSTTQQTLSSVSVLGAFFVHDQISTKLNLDSVAHSHAKNTRPL